MKTDEQKDKLLKMLDPVWEKEQRALLEQIPGWKEACEADDECEESEYQYVIDAQTRDGWNL